MHAALRLVDDISEGSVELQASNSLMNTRCVRRAFVHVTWGAVSCRFMMENNNDKKDAD